MLGEGMRRQSSVYFFWYAALPAAPLPEAPPCGNTAETTLFALVEVPSRASNFHASARHPPKLGIASKRHAQ